MDVSGAGCRITLVRIVRELSKLNETALHRLSRLRVLANCCSLPVTQPDDRLVAFVVIETFNLWSTFARFLYLSSCLSATTVSGTRVSLSKCTFMSTNDALCFAIQEIKGKSIRKPRRQDEPPWHMVNILLKLFNATGASNLPQVQSGASFQAHMFEELRTMRHFFAHRNQETAERVRQIARNRSISLKSRPSEVACSIPTGRPQSLLADWQDHLRTAISLSCR